MHVKVQFNLKFVIFEQTFEVLALYISSTHNHQKQPWWRSIKKGVLKNSAKFTRNKRKRKKETQTHVFFCDFCVFFKNNFSTEHLRVYPF